MIEGLDFTTLSVPTGIKARYVEAYMGASRDRPAPSGSSGVQLSAPSTLQQLQRAANAAAAAGKERAAFHVPAWSLRAMHARLDERLAAAKVGTSTGTPDVMGDGADLKIGGGQPTKTGKQSAEASPILTGGQSVSIQLLS
jgi:hypothetical protein